VFHMGAIWGASDRVDRTDIFCQLYMV